MDAQTRTLLQDGYYDDEWMEFHGSEISGVGVDDEARSRDGFDAWDTNVLAFLHRDEDDDRILRRWNVNEGQWSNDLLDELQDIEDNNDRHVWVERMTAFREAQLRRLLRDYFGAADYMQREIVLKWEQVDGRWKPAEKMIVRDWVNRQIDVKGSRLAGFSSCAGTIRQKLTRKRVARSGEAWWKKTA